MAIFTEKRKSRIRYYSRAIVQHLLVPNLYYRRMLNRRMALLERLNPDEVLDRVNYYNKLEMPFDTTGSARRLKDLPRTKQTMSYYDYREALRYFPVEARADLIFNDYFSVPETPTFLKSRRIADNNGNGVLLKLRKVRHYQPATDERPFESKKARLVWRGAGWQQHRLEFLRQCWNHPLCDVGQVNPPSELAPAEWVKPRMSIAEQQQFKYILSLQGTDIATNIKWIAQSNSLCFMTRPKVEDWFMDGRLKPAIHYVELRDDYADITEKIEYYEKHPQEAQDIIANLHRHYKQFMNPQQEELISLMVVMKYLKLSGQWS